MLLLASALTLTGCERSDAKGPAARAVSSATGTEVKSGPKREVDRKDQSPPPPTEVEFGASKAQFFLPEGMATAAKPAFVLILHGLGGSGSELVAALGLTAFANEKRFAFAAPDGTRDRQGRRFWNANEVCCNFGQADVDDEARLIGLIDYAVEVLHTDPKRVFVVGYSNGGFMAHRLACAHAERVRAIVSIAAAGPDAAQRCAPSEAVDVLEIHGEKDSIVPFGGGHLFSRPELPRSPSVPAGLRVWAEKARCSGDLLPLRSFDFIAELPGEDSEVFHFANCRENSPVLWKIKGAQHVIPLGEPALSAIWNFLTALG